MPEFHERSFQDHTMVKLALFKGYVRNWLPVFLTESPRTQHIRVIRIFDLFAGPGKDANGTLGSPLIILEEIKKYCLQRANVRKKDLTVKLLFNDLSRKNIAQLKLEVAKHKCPKVCCSIDFESRPFDAIFPELLPSLRDHQSANLLIIDQFGVNNLTPDVFREIVASQRTDLLCFFASSALKRFLREESMGQRFGLHPSDLASVSHFDIHRWFCQNYFRKLVPSKVEYHLAPFSLKRKSNIYGVIFGSRNEKGLEQFLRVCWKVDPDTGEANYNIDDDIIVDGQQSLFPEQNASTKLLRFAKDLEDFIKAEARTNRAIQLFTHEHGCLTSHATDTLRVLQRDKKIVVHFHDPNRAPPRKGAFYLSKLEKNVCIKWVG